jgi:uncharacterized protein with ParB-like and HNH nuclease domain
MPTIYEPAKKTLGDLLGNPSRKTAVPDYQRDYSWSEGHIDYFWQDILEFMQAHNETTLKSAEYFIGSMVRIENEAGYELLDGQQRLATAVILLSSIRDHLKPLNRQASQRTADKWIVDLDDLTDNRKYSLTLSRYDRDYFRRRIQDENALPPSANSESQRLIDSARKKFDREIQSHLQECDDAAKKTSWLLMLRSALVEHVTTVTVTCVSEDDAAAIFETLNDRGLGLSTVDLLRNLLLRQAGEQERDEILSIWGEILAESLTVDVQDFLRHYWTSRHGDIKSQRLYRVIREHLKGPNTESSLDFMRDLGDAHKSYIRLLRPDFYDRDTNEALYDIADLKAKMLYPLLLSSLRINEASIQPVLTAAVVFYVRNVIVARQGGAFAENVLFSAAKELYDTGDVSKILQQLYAKSVSQGSFEEAAISLSNLETAQSRYLLRTIEIARRGNDETDVARQPRIHVEHIYPQNPKGAKWPNHNIYINKLGNLTILSRRINTSIKNSLFAQKKGELARSELHLTQEVSTHAQWTHKEIDERQQKLAAEIIKIWAWPQFIIDPAQASG